MPKKKNDRPTDCGVCKYHVNITKECRRRAPHPSQDDGFVIAVWNRTRDRDRCGDGSTTKEIVLCDDCEHWLTNQVTSRCRRRSVRGCRASGGKIAALHALSARCDCK